MISLCPHCRRSVATGETIVHTRAGWVPSLCCNGESGPLPSGRYENVANHPHFYTSVADGNRAALLTGPFPTYELARDDLFRAKVLAIGSDPRAAFYAYGVASSVEPARVLFPSEPVRTKNPRG